MKFAELTNAGIEYVLPSYDYLDYKMIYGHYERNSNENVKTNINFDYVKSFSTVKSDVFAMKTIDNDDYAKASIVRRMFENLTKTSKKLELVESNAEFTKIEMNDGSEIYVKETSSQIKAILASN